MRPFLIALILFLIVGAATQAQPFVIAHGGDHSQAPAHSPTAFSRAVRLGVDYIKVDLRQTRDGELVVFQDETLDRVAGVRGRIADKDLAELKKLPLHDPEYPDQSFYIATFTEVLNVASAAALRMYVDFKDAPMVKAYEEIWAASMESYVTVHVYNESDVNEWRRMAPHVQVILTPPASSGPWTFQQFLQNNDANILGGSYTLYTTEKVALAHRAGLQVWAEIPPNHEEDFWDQVLSLGVDGIVTNQAAALMIYLRSTGR